MYKILLIMVHNIMVMEMIPKIVAGNYVGNWCRKSMQEIVCKIGVDVEFFVENGGENLCG